MLKGKQKNLDKNKDGKITGEDFKMMKAKYGKMMKAKSGKDVDIDLIEKIAEKSLFGSGRMKAKKKMMGGEMKKPMKAKYGKMMKARYGTMAKGDVKEGISKSNEFKNKLENFKKDSIRKLRGAQAGPAEEAKLNEMMPSMKDSPSVREAKMKTVKMKLSKMKYGKMVKAKKGVMVKKPEEIKSLRQSATPGYYPKDDMPKKSMGGEMKSTQGYGAARTSGMGLQDEDLIPGKSMDYYKDLM